MKEDRKYGKTWILNIAKKNEAVGFREEKPESEGQVAEGSAVIGDVKGWGNVSVWGAERLFIG